jgi:protein TonB
MMRQNSVMFLIAAGISVTVHGAGLLAAKTDETTVSMASAPPSVELLGNDFADSVTGASPRVSPQTTKSPSPSQPPLKATVEPAETASLTASASPEVATREVADLPSLSPSVAAKVTATAPSTVSPTPPPTLTKTLETVAPTRSETTTATLRPVARPSVENTPKTPVTKKVIAETAEAPRPAKPQNSQSAGAGASMAKRGTSTGKKSGTTTNAGQGDDAQSVAKAQSRAARSYAGQVFRRISRTKRKRFNSRKVSVVVFSIGDNGQLKSLSIQRSSGVPALDAIALDLVRRSAPFPKPPEGAPRRFPIEVSGRN